MMTYNEKEELKREINNTISIMEQTGMKDYLFQQITHTSGFDNKCSPLYLFGTEDMRTYYKEYGSPETFLTIGASGDQLLNAILLGAKKIDVFDSNPLSKRGCALKVSAFIELSKKDFLKFYRRFSVGIFNRFSNSLSEKDYAYWNSLYELKSADDIANHLFAYNRLESEIIKKINPYLDDDNYEKLKDLIKNVEINYHDADLYSLPKYLKGKKYDGINLSNIYEYIVFGAKTNEAEVAAFYEFIMNEIYPHLNNGGKAMIAYMYAFNDAVKKFVDELYLEHPDKFLPSGAIRMVDLPYYQKGLTAQNRSYSLLLDKFEQEPIEKIATEHIVYGQSVDMSHDMAIMLKK